MKLEIDELWLNESLAYERRHDLARTENDRHKIIEWALLGRESNRDELARCNDSEFETAIITSSRNPTHCSLFPDPDEREVWAKTLLSSNEVFRLRKIPKGYVQSITEHEKEGHHRPTVGTEIRREQVLAALSGRADQFTEMFNTKVRPYLEAVASFKQIFFHKTPAILSEKLVEDIAAHDPSAYRILQKLTEAYVRLRNLTGHWWEWNTIRQCLTNWLIRTPPRDSMSLDEELWIRVKCLSEIPYHKIGTWSRRNFEDLFFRETRIGTPEATDKLLLHNTEFYHKVREIVSQYDQATTTLRVFKNIFGILNVFSPYWFVPITYEVDSLERYSNPQIVSCILGLKALSGYWFRSDFLERCMYAADSIILLSKDRSISERILCMKHEISLLREIHCVFFQLCLSSQQEGKKRCRGMPSCVAQVWLANAIMSWFVGSPINFRDVIPRQTQHSMIYEDLYGTLPFDAAYVYAALWPLRENCGESNFEVRYESLLSQLDGVGNVTLANRNICSDSLRSHCRALTPRKLDTILRYLTQIEWVNWVEPSGKIVVHFSRPRVRDDRTLITRKRAKDDPRFTIQQRQGSLTDYTKRRELPRCSEKGF